MPDQIVSIEGTVPVSIVDDGGGRIVYQIVPGFQAVSGSRTLGLVYPMDFRNAHGYWKSNLGLGYQDFAHGFILSSLNTEAKEFFSTDIVIETVIRNGFTFTNAGYGWGVRPAGNLSVGKQLWNLFVVLEAIQDGWTEGGVREQLAVIGIEL
jgi:hypothetical protein